MRLALHRHEFNGVKIFLFLPSGIIFEFHGVNFFNAPALRDPDSGIYATLQPAGCELKPENAIRLAAGGKGQKSEIESQRAEIRSQRSDFGMNK